MRDRENETKRSRMRPPMAPTLENIRMTTIDVLIPAMAGAFTIFLALIHPLAAIGWAMIVLMVVL